MVNISIAKQFALAFCALLESFCLDGSAGFRHDPSMQLVTDRDLGVFCAVPSQLRDFFEHHGIIRLLECTSVNPVVFLPGYASGSDGCLECIRMCWLVFVLVEYWCRSHLKEYRASEQDRREPTKRFISAVAVARLGSFIQI